MHNLSTPLIDQCSGRITRAHAPDLEILEPSATLHPVDRARLRHLIGNRCAFRGEAARMGKRFESWCWERWPRPSSGSRCP